MSPGFFVAYLFVCFTVGVACLGANFMLALRRRDTLARAFLVPYAALTLLVTGSLLRGFVELQAPDVGGALRFGVEYLESMVGFYGLMFGVPLFAHRLFAVEASRDRLLAAVVIAAAGLQHLTEYGLGDPWDERGDLVENLLLTAVVLYTAGVGFARISFAGVDRPLAMRFLALLSIGLPAVAHDLFLAEKTGYPVYPLGYCVVSVVITLSLIRRRSAASAGALPAAWGLSNREAEVARLVQQGHSNRVIAEQLHISPNTVKTHLRAIFDKSGVSSRFELIAAARAEPGTGDAPE